jgi:hypothetical protein
MSEQNIPQVHGSAVEFRMSGKLNYGTVL